jgi:hypothetical protein
VSFRVVSAKLDKDQVVHDWRRADLLEQTEDSFYGFFPKIRIRLNLGIVTLRRCFLLVAAAGKRTKVRVLAKTI